MHGDAQRRATAHSRSSIAVVAETEPLRPLPAVPYPGDRLRDPHRLETGVGVLLGNRYPVPPKLAADEVTVSHPAGGQFCDIATTGIVVARHRMAADGLGVMVRDSGHVIALDTTAMATAATGRPHRRKERILPGLATKNAAAQLYQFRDATTGIAESTKAIIGVVPDAGVFGEPVASFGWLPRRRAMRKFRREQGNHHRFSLFVGLSE